MCQPTLAQDVKLKDIRARSKRFMGVIVGRLIVWGAGELGGRVAGLWRSQSEAVLALTRTKDKHGRLQDLGADTGLGDPVEWTADDALLISIAGTAKLGDAIARVADREPPGRVVLTSSTGFYQGLGGPLDANSGPGTTERAQQINAVETAFKRWTGDHGVILRLGGLYRPGRGPLNALKRRGHAPAGPADSTLALVHYDDAATATFEALRIVKPKSTYIVVTPPCPTRRDFYLAASVILELPLPSFGIPLDGPRADYDVSTLRADLLPTPKHPQWQGALVP